MREVEIKGEAVPAMGQGTWNMGERAGARADEVRALRRGLDLGLTLIDTAEMYADGGAEEVVGEAIEGRREGVYLVSKVYPHNASKQGVQDACARSLRRLKTDRIDLYLLHWPGSYPLEETVAGFEALQDAGHIRHWGVSNFDVDEMEDLVETAGGDAVAANQVLYNLTRRGIEWDLMPWCAERSVPIMAYSPIEQGRLDQGGALAEVAKRHGTAPYAVALAWVLRRPNVIAIPKAVQTAHVEANRAAADLVLIDRDLAELDAAFPAPKGKRRLAML